MLAHRIKGETSFFAMCEASVADDADIDFPKGPAIQNDKTVGAKVFDHINYAIALPATRRTQGDMFGPNANMLRGPFATKAAAARSLKVVAIP